MHDHYHSKWDDLLALPTNIRKLVKFMSDVSPLLNEVATGLRGLGGSVAALVAENAQLRADNAELSGEDVAESTAAADVKSAFDELAGKFTSNPDTPDVDPLPPVDEPPVGGGDAGSGDEAPGL